MTLIRYSGRNLGPAILDKVRRANAIVEQYQAQGLSMSVRQIFYQFVKRNWIPNDDKQYDVIQQAVDAGRMAGLISWDAIEDRNRFMRGLDSHASPVAAVKAAREGYRIDLWADQPWAPVVLVEKAALEGVLAGICNELRVDFMATRGYNSQSETWRLGQRCARMVQQGRRPIIFHLGDHDASGIDMTRDLRDRVTLFADYPVPVQRLALNMNQVEEYAPPPNPAKRTDGRTAKYTRWMESQGYDHGTSRSSWELDALEPTVIRELIRDAVMRIRDEALWDAALAREAADLDTLDIMMETMG